MAEAPAFRAVQSMLHLPRSCSGPSSAHDPSGLRLFDLQNKKITKAGRSLEAPDTPVGQGLTRQHMRTPVGGLHPVGELCPKHAFYSDTKGRAVRKAMCCGGRGWWEQEKCQLPWPGLGPCADGLVRGESTCMQRTTEKTWWDGGGGWEGDLMLFSLEWSAS